MPWQIPCQRLARSIEQQLAGGSNSFPAVLPASFPGQTFSTKKLRFQRVLLTLFVEGKDPVGCDGVSIGALVHPADLTRR